MKNDVLEFLSKTNKFRKEEEISPKFIINFDETSIFYDTIPNYTYRSFSKGLGKLINLKLKTIKHLIDEY